MADVTVKRVEEMESIWGGSFVRARASLGASSFGMNIWNFPPNWDQYWEHNHVEPPAADNEEEVYTALSGKATLLVAGEEHVLEPGVFARVGVGRSARSRRVVRVSSCSASARRPERRTRPYRSSSSAARPVSERLSEALQGPRAPVARTDGLRRVGLLRGRFGNRRGGAARSGCRRT